MGLFGWIKPGNDQQLADNLATDRRNQRSRSATRADRKGQQWNDREQTRGPKTTGWFRS